MRLSVRSLLAYKRSLPGRPYLHGHELTEQFREGVGYFKNLLHYEPVMLMCIVTFAGCFAVGGLAYKQALDVDTDYARPFKHRYTVKRSADVSDPSKDCFN
ncbi:uncharacterized protein LOC128222005 [Mya arenaria]|uniref:uncharacterized protein LOC128222005 n=1 Tax=Mya arenaria TaxID=6604 RepID=UPI0022E769FF|nr:uncharacterized protein LOC128222005 [Mya arenaria]